MKQLLDSLGRSLAELPGSPREYAVAFSGGLDSTVLLAAMCRLTPRPQVRAMHVDHVLHPDSKRWERHCKAVAAALGVDFESRRCPVEPTPGESLEAQARQVRYGALADLVAPGEVLLTAHHADDQLETLLMRLLRGTGVKGLRGIAALQPFGAGFMARPLLAMARAEILAAGRAWELEWLEDPSNRDTRFDRNYLRAELLPRIAERWPAAARTVGRAATQMAEAQQILDEVAWADARQILELDEAAPARARKNPDGAGREDARQILDEGGRVEATGGPGRLDCSALCDLSPARRRNLLRHSIVRLGLPAPDARQMETLLEALEVRRRDARTCVQWPGGEARIYRDRLYLLEPLPAASPAGYAGEVSLARPWSGPEGRLRLVSAPGPGLPGSWAEEGFAVRFREGGERFRPLGRQHSRPLKKWLQEAGVAPWLRARIPLLYREDALVAVGDLWVSAAAGGDGAGQPQWRVQWTDHLPLA